jgi:hypothetical protein
MDTQGDVGSTPGAFIRGLRTALGLDPVAAHFAAEQAGGADFPSISPSVATIHPEIADLVTSDPVKQEAIDEKEIEYLENMTGAQILDLAEQRGYLSFTDSHGNPLPSFCMTVAKWLAAWDVLKSEKEKRLWMTHRSTLTPQLCRKFRISQR